MAAMVKLGNYLSKKNLQKPFVKSSDGHIVPKEDDLTCDTVYGHQHSQANEFGRRYIVHEEPEEGYVVLNGVKRQIKDCKDL